MDSRLSLLALLLVPSALGAQDTRLRERLDAPTARAITTIIDSAARAGIPAEPLVQKALEGAVKRASGPRVASAVRLLAASLGDARNALGKAASVAELVAGAGAIQAGVSGEALRSMRARRDGSLAVALATLADLVAHGVPADRAVDAVRSAIDRRASDADLVGMRDAIAKDIKAGAPPGSAAAIRARGPGVGPPSAAPPASAGGARPRDKSRGRSK